MALSEELSKLADLLDAEAVDAEDREDLEFTLHRVAGLLREMADLYAV